MRERQRRGFALMWVIVVVAVLATIAGAAAPYLDNVGDTERVRRTSEILHLLADGVESFRNSVKTAPTKLTTPHFLSQLTTQSVVNGDSAGCNDFDYNTAAETAWPVDAPYTSIYVPV